MLKILLFVVITTVVSAQEPISPIPLEDNVNMEKARLGMKLFMDPMLSKDNSTACISCHNVYDGGADTRVVSVGFENKKGNIQSPTVLNSKYNFKQFWNGRANDLFEQAEGPMTNPVEHNMDKETLEKRINNSKEYKTEFKDIYGVSHITYNLVIDAIVEFENSLVTPNSKFDKFLRNEIELSHYEQEGYTLFKQYGCITCHNGINIGGNSFQKMGTFLDYKYSADYPDRSALTKSKSHINVFKVPTLRNISLTAPYFHDASAKTLEEAIAIMSKHNLGIEISDEQIAKIVLFLKTLDGERPKILDIK